MPPASHRIMLGALDMIQHQSRLLHRQHHRPVEARL
jgi:hypothetical protein